MINAKNITFEQGGQILFENLHLGLKAGQGLAILGANGAGKTSLLRVLSGLCPPQKGVVHSDPDEILYIGHQNALKPSLTLIENLRFWTDLFGVKDISKNQIEGILERFNLAHLSNHPCRALSAGQARRASLVRLALLPRKTWLLDEPLSTLDKSGFALFESLLAAHLQNGGVAAIATHTPISGLKKTLHISDFQPGSEAYDAQNFSS